MDNRITFRLYQIDSTLPMEVIGDYLFKNTANKVKPSIYRMVWESKEVNDLDIIYAKNNSDERPNGHYCRSISLSDVLGIEDAAGNNMFYICDSFGWTETEFNISMVKK